MEFSEPQIDPLLKETVAGGRAAQMRYVVGETPFAVIGIPYFDIDAAYYEAVPLDDIAATLSSLLIALLTGSGITVLVGIGIGIWAAQRAVRPLTDIGEAAEAIAAGDLNTRLEGADPDLERLSRSFNQMASALQGRIERDARFTSNVSHELRSPLMTLTASLEVLRKRQDELPVRSQTALNLLSADLDHFKQLVADLLEISRYDVGAAALETEDFEIIEFVQQAARAAGHSPRLTHSPRAQGLVVRGRQETARPGHGQPPGECQQSRRGSHPDTRRAPRVRRRDRRDRRRAGRGTRGSRRHLRPLRPGAPAGIGGAVQRHRARPGTCGRARSPARRVGPA